MKDETFCFIQDVKEKKSTARSARNKRTHNGKGGMVKLPSDFMTRKEINAMNGEVKAYRMNDPMKWAEFKAMPDDIKRDYIKILRSKFNAPGKYIAAMMGVNYTYYSNEIVRLGISEGKNSRGRCTPWDKEGFAAWCNGATVNSGASVVESQEASEQATEQAPQCENKCVDFAPPVVSQKSATPCNGSMIFECPANMALDVISKVLGTAKVHLLIEWDTL